MKYKEVIFFSANIKITLIKYTVIINRMTRILDKTICESKFTVSPMCLVSKNKNFDFFIAFFTVFSKNIVVKR